MHQLGTTINRWGTTVANPPTPTTLARNLRQLADRLDDEGERAVRRAPVLAARGYPTSTNGSEGGRSSDPTSSTERAALNPGMFDDIDGRLREHMRLCWYMAVKIHANLDVILHHAPDDDPIPFGQGVCDRCGLICKGGADSPRIHKNQLCHACNEAFRRWKRKHSGTKMDFLVHTAGNAAYDNVRRRLGEGA